tara:strand:- start:542 stop:1093 length:552 start_codon:yes stop_codon:yes gene_type:complete
MKRNLPLAIRHGVIIPLVVMVPAFLIFGDDPIQGALAACVITGVCAAIMLCMWVFDGVCYHFDVWDKLSAAYDHVMIHYLAAHIIYPLYETIEDGETLNDLNGETIDGLMEDVGDLQTRILELEHELHFEGERKRVILSQLDFLRIEHNALKECVRTGIMEIDCWGDDPPPNTPGVTWVKVPE